MNRTVVAAALAFAGAALTVPAANAAVFAPAHSVLREQAAPAVIQVQRPSRGAGPRTFSRPAVRPSRPSIGRPAAGLRPGRSISRPGSVRPGIRPGVRPGGVARPSVRPGFRPRGPVVGRHIRGYRPPGFRRWHPRHLVYRPWYRRPYYGRIIGGVALGTLLAATAYYAYADSPPADGLCWFWADDQETQGYWDYCIDP